MLSRVRFGAHRGHRVGRFSTERLPVLCRRSARGDEGAALVEFALILPIFMMMVLGAITGGLAYDHKQQLTSAAREGARFGAVLNPKQCTPTSVCGNLTWAQFVQQETVQRSNGTLQTNQVCVALVTGSATPTKSSSDYYVNTPNGQGYCFVDQTTTTSSTTTSSTTTTTTPEDLGQRVQVAVSRPDTMNILVYTINLTLSSQATAHYEA